MNDGTDRRHQPADSRSRPLVNSQRILVRHLTWGCSIKPSLYAGCSNGHDGNLNIAIIKPINDALYVRFPHVPEESDS